MRTPTAALLILALACSTANAVSIQECLTDKTRRDLCLGIVYGVTVTAVAFEKVCKPDAVTIGQVYAVVNEYARTLPETSWQADWAVSTYAAILLKWYCQKSGKPAR
jgi:hypothetical protein